MELNEMRTVTVPKTWLQSFPHKLMPRHKRAVVAFLLEGDKRGPPGSLVSAWGPGEVNTLQRTTTLGILLDLETKGHCRDVRESGDAYLCEISQGSRQAAN